MKRSEMVVKMAKGIKNSLGDRISIVEAVKCADDLLAKVEESGMLPPLTKLSHLDSSDNAWDKE